jgi:hypothetical protein
LENLDRSTQNEDFAKRPRAMRPTFRPSFSEARSADDDDISEGYDAPRLRDAITQAQSFAQRMLARAVRQQ